MPLAACCQCIACGEENTGGSAEGGPVAPFFGAVHGNVTITFINSLTMVRVRTVGDGLDGAGHDSSICAGILFSSALLFSASVLTRLLRSERGVRESVFRVLATAKNAVGLDFFECGELRKT